MFLCFGSVATASLFSDDFSVDTRLHSYRYRDSSKVSIALAGSSTGEPYANPSTGFKNILIREYNDVINNLAAEPTNEIIVTPRTSTAILRFTMQMNTLIGFILMALVISPWLTCGFKP